jgi:hypothetical protein
VRAGIAVGGWRGHPTDCQAAQPTGFGLAAAGGVVLAPDGAPQRYGPSGFRNTDFIATAKPSA